MSQFFDWLPWMALSIAMVAVWILPTYFWLRLARVPAAAAAAVAPPATSGLVILLSILYWKAGWFWSGARVIPALLVIGALGAALFWFRPRRSGPGRARFSLRLWSVGFVVAAGMGWLLAALPTMIAAPPINPPQQWDPSFHLNGVWGITQLGIGAPGPGLAHNYGGADASGYPIGWHTYTSLFATPETTVQTANASSLAIMLVWIIGAAVYTYALYPSRRAALAAAVIAGIMPSMPADALTAYSQWPNALSVAFLPGGAVAALLFGRALMETLGHGQWSRVSLTATQPERLRSRVRPIPLRSRSRSTLFLLGLVLAVTLVGGVEAHQVYAFNLLVLLLPAVVAGWWQVFSDAVIRSKWSMVFSAWLLASVALLGFLWIQLRPEMDSLRSYPRDGVNLATGLSQALVPNPPFTLTFGLMAFNAVFVVLLVLGIVRVIVGRYSTRPWARWPGLSRPLGWPVVSYLLFAVLVFFAYGPNWSVREWIVGPWFLDGRRIMEPASLALVPLLAIGFGWLAYWIPRWWKGQEETPGAKLESRVSVLLGAILLVASGVGALDARIAAARAVLDPAHLGKSGMATQGELDLMRRIPQLIPEDSVVLGDPQAGAMYAQVIGQRWAYFPQLSLMNEDADTESTIISSFRNLNTDPHVCEAVRDAGITHFIEVPDGAYYGRVRSERMPGLYNVDTSTGFELIDTGDQYRLYKITACETE